MERDKIQLCRDAAGDGFMTHFNEAWFGDEVFLIKRSDDPTIAAGFARVCIDKDNDDVAYIDMLSVLEDHRGHGFGNEILKTCEDIALCLDCTCVMLYVEVGSWMYDWYARHGYKYVVMHDDMKEMAWLRKNLQNDTWSNLGKIGVDIQHVECKYEPEHEPGEDAPLV